MPWNEAHHIALAGIEHVVVTDADTVGFDAADAVFGGFASIHYRDILPGGDAVCMFALHAAAGESLVAIAVNANMRRARR